MPNGLIFAHRVATSATRDITLNAIKTAVAAGADGLDLDIQASNGRFVHRDIELAEIIELVRGRARLGLELESAAAAGPLVSLIADHGLSAADVIVTSFDASVVKRIVDIDADVLTGWRTQTGAVADVIDTYFECGADVVAPRHDLLTRDFLREAEAEEVALLPWTVNDAGSMRWLLKSDAVLGIITEKIGEAVRVRNENR